MEIFDIKERVKNLEESLSNLQKEYDRKETCLKQERSKYETEIKELKSLVDQLTSNTSSRDCQNGKRDEANVGEGVRIQTVFSVLPRCYIKIFCI